jgi:hypothetical protein
MRGRHVELLYKAAAEKPLPDFRLGFFYVCLNSGRTLCAVLEFALMTFPAD